MTFVVRIDLVQYTGLDSLVWCELISFCFFVDGSTNVFGTVRVRLVRKCQLAPCYSKITTRAKTPTSYEILTREMPVIPLNRKNRVKSMGVLS